jgi:DNA primase
MINESEVLSLFERHCSLVKSSGGSQYQALCPFHPDTHHSFSFKTDTTQYYCHTCNEKGNAVKFAKLKGEDPKPFYSDDYQRTDRKQAVKPIKNGLNGGKSVVKLSESELRNKTTGYMSNMNTDDLPFFQMNMVGKDNSGRMTFPYFSENGKSVLGIKHHKSESGGMPYWEGDGTCKWYNEWNINFQTVRIFIVEGEKDVLLMAEKKFDVISSSNGAKSIPKYTSEVIQVAQCLFNTGEVIILYDNDKAGREGSVKLANALHSELDIPIYIGQWRDGLPDKYDVTDSRLGDEFEYAINNKRMYEPRNEISGVNDSQKGYTVVSVLDALKMDIHKPRMLIEDLLNENCTLLLSAEDNVGKSMMANQMGLCLASGQDFLGYLVPEPIKVLLVQHEMENGEQTDRLKTQVVTFVESYPDLMAKNLFMNLIQESENLAVTDQFEMLERTFTHNPEIEVCVFDNIGQSTNVAMTKPDEIRQELKRLKALCRRHKVAFVLVAHHNKIDWGKEMDLVKTQIQGGKPVTDWADNVLQLHTSSLNTGLVLFKVTKVRSVHAQDGTTSKNLPQAVWFNNDNDLLFKDRFTVTNWQGHFKALDKFEDELKFVEELATYPQPFTTNDAINVGDKFDKSVTTIKAHWLKKLVNPMGWLIKEGHGLYRVNQKVMDFIKISED